MKGELKLKEFHRILTASMNDWCHYNLDIQLHTRDIIKIIYVSLDFDVGRKEMETIFNQKNKESIKSCQ